VQAAACSDLSGDSIYVAGGGAVQSDVHPIIVRLARAA